LEQYHNPDHKVVATMKWRYMSDKNQRKELARLAEEEEVNATIDKACVDLEKKWERATAAKIKRRNAAILKVQNALVDLELSYLSWDCEEKVEEGGGAPGDDTIMSDGVGTEDAALGGSAGTEIELQEYKRCFHLPDIEKQMGLDTIHAIQRLVSIEKKALISAIKKEEAKIEKSQQKRQRTAATINQALEEEVEVRTALCFFLILFLLSFLLAEHSLS
jgi:hypothetical protein